MENNPFPDLKIKPPYFLENIEGRSKCPLCGKSRKYYCYGCYIPLGGEQYEKKVPRLKLPVKIDVIKHPQEVDGKSTAVHAAVLAPNHVTIHTYPSIPEYKDKSKVLLVYPGNDAVTLHDYVTSMCRQVVLKHNESIIDSETTGKESNDSESRQQKVFAGDAESDYKDFRNIRPVGNEGILIHRDNESVIQTDDSINENRRENHSLCSDDNESKLDHQDRQSKNVDNESESKLGVYGDKPSNKADIESSPSQSKGLNKSTVDQPTQPLYQPSFDRVLFIDSTWHTVNKIALDDRLKGFQKIELNAQKTKFWRHQAGKPDTYLATVEAMYYFLREYHEHFVGTEYDGEYDNLLFYFIFMYDKIRHMYKDGRYLKAYNNGRTMKN